VEQKAVYETRDPAERMDTSPGAHRNRRACLCPLQLALHAMVPPSKRGAYPGGKMMSEPFSRLSRSCPAGWSALGMVPKPVLRNASMVGRCQKRVRIFQRTSGRLNPSKANRTEVSTMVLSSFDEITLQLFKKVEQAFVPKKH